MYFSREMEHIYITFTYTLSDYVFQIADATV